MGNLKINTGEWHAVEFAGIIMIQNGPHYEDTNILDFDEVGRAKALANAELIIDAGNTANKSGFLPSELLAQKEELMTFVKKHFLTTSDHRFSREANEIITKIEKK